MKSKALLIAAIFAWVMFGVPAFAAETSDSETPLPVVPPGEQVEERFQGKDGATTTDTEETPLPVVPPAEQVEERFQGKDQVTTDSEESPLPVVPPGEQVDQMQDGSGQQQQAMRQDSMHRASELIGQNVVSEQGEKLGSIENLLINENGSVEYVILSRGGLLGTGISSKLVPVPWQAADLRVQQDQVIAGIDKQTLENAPTFEGDNWAQFGTPGYEEEVQGYFESQP